MATFRFSNFNIGFHNSDSLGTGFLTKSNYGTVWECEYACTKTLGVSDYPNTGNVFYQSLHSNNVSSVFNKDYWSQVQETFTFTIKLKSGFAFPESLTDSVINLRFQVPSSTTDTEFVIDDTNLTGAGTGSWITRGSVYYTLSLTSTTITLQFKPSNWSYSSYNSKKVVVIWLCNGRVVDSGLPYITTTQSFRGDDDTTNCTVNGLLDSYEENDNATLTCNANNLYHLFEAPFITMNGNNIPFELVDDVWTVSFTVTDNFTINGTAKRVIRFVDTSVTGITFDKPLNQLIDVSNVSAGNPLVIIGTPQNRFYINATTNHPYIKSESDTNYYFSFSGPQTHVDYIRYEFTGFNDSDGTDLQIFAQASYTYVNYGFVAAYNPTQNQMLELADKRFYNVIQGEFADYSSYIISIHKIHVNPNMITAWITKSVKYGKYDTNISCNLFPDTIIELDCGSITIDELYQNRIDYDNTTIEAYLPFIGIVTLDVDRFMDKTVNLKYRVNVFNGACLAIFDTPQGTQQIFEGNLSMKIPIRSSFDNGGINVSQIDENTYYLMNTYVPYVDVSTNIPYEPEAEQFPDRDNRQGLIGSFTGQCLFSDVLMPMSNMTQSEYDEIMSILRSGVIITPLPPVPMFYNIRIEVNSTDYVPKMTNIKAVRRIRPDLSLTQAKDLVEAAPLDVFESPLSLEAATIAYNDVISYVLSDCGATMEQAKAVYTLHEVSE